LSKMRWTRLAIAPLTMCIPLMEVTVRID
jgi:hypothetical protein